MGRTIIGVGTARVARAAFAGATAVLLALPLVSARAQTPGAPGTMHYQPPSQVVTSAVGEVNATPDQATVLFAVESRGATAAEAAQRNARTQTAVLDTLRRMGIPREQIGTLGYAVRPEYRYPSEGGEPRVVGYVARNTVRVELRRIDQVGAAIDAALAKGANNVSGLRFQSSRAEELRREALRAAVRNARADAQAMAEAAGGSLGELLEVSTHMFEPPMPMMEMAAAARGGPDMAPTPVSPGEQAVRVNVTTRWRFVGGGAR